MDLSANFPDKDVKLTRQLVVHQLTHPITNYIESYVIIGKMAYQVQQIENGETINYPVIIDNKKYSLEDKSSHEPFVVEPNFLAYLNEYENYTHVMKILDLKLVS